MDPDAVIQLIVLVILLVLSAFFSSAETALTTVNRIKVRAMAEEGNKRAKIVLKVTDDSAKMLSAILVGNNIVNLSASSIATILGVKLWDSIGAGIATGILTVVVLIFGEIVPKTAAHVNSLKVSLRYAGIILGLMNILTPVIFVINAVGRTILKAIKVNPDDVEDVVTEDELRIMINESLEDGEIETEEQRLIHKVFNFSDAQVKEVMVPRVDVTMVEVNSTLSELLEIYRDKMFTRIPVFEGSADNIVGIVNMKDIVLLEDRENFNLRDHIREVYTTYETKKTMDLFSTMREESISLAIVFDEYGTVAGIVSMEDLLEEIVGEIRDEYDEDEEDLFTKLDEREFIVQGVMNLEDACEALGLSFESEDYDSIGGYLIGLLDHIPEEKETCLTEDGVYLRVEEMEQNRIGKIFVRVPEKENEEDEE